MSRQTSSLSGSLARITISKRFQCALQERSFSWFCHGPIVIGRAIRLAYCVSIRHSYTLAAMQALRSYLHRTHTSQKAFAKRVGVSQPTIANLVNGVHSASADLLKRISRATGLSADELLADDAGPTADRVA